MYILAGTTRATCTLIVTNETHTRGLCPQFTDFVIKIPIKAGLCPFLSQYKDTVCQT